MPNIGVNSCIVREITGRGLSLDELRIDLIEVGFDDLPLVTEKGINMDSVELLRTLDVGYTLHAPTSDARTVRVNLGVKSEKNIKIMGNVLKIASLLDAEYVVVHGGDVNGSYHKAFLNTIEQLKVIAKMAKDYSIKLTIENLCDKRIGALPYELFPFLNLGLGLTFDTAHAFLISKKYGIPYEEYFKLMSYADHIHLHDNNGVVDEHRALGEGIINLDHVMNGLRNINPKNIILEIINYSKPENIIRSIEIVRFQRFPYINRAEKVRARA